MIEVSDIRRGSVLEREFAMRWGALTPQAPRLNREVKFNSERKWRFDFAHPASKVAIECEGGVWSRGRHTRGGGFVSDARKYAEAQMSGWIVFRLEGRLIRDWKFLQRLAEFIRQNTPEETSND